MDPSAAAGADTQLTVAAIIKLLVDTLKLCWGGKPDRQPPLWLPSVVAMILGVAFVAVALLARGVDLTQVGAAARAFQDGLAAAAGAIGITQLHSVARAHIPAAPALPPQAAPVGLRG
jgi:hypothetical protein